MTLHPERPQSDSPKPLNKTTHVRITRTYKMLLDDLGRPHKRTAAKQLEWMIDQALAEQGEQR